MSDFPQQLHGQKMNDNTSNPNTGAIQSASITIHGISLTGAIYDAELAKFVTLVAAMQAVSLGRFTVRTFAGNSVLVGTDSPATSLASQVSQGWIVRVITDTSFHKHSFRIACADTAFLQPNRERMLETSAEYIALDAAIVDFVSYGGEAVTVRDILFKGKA